jgi:hypothetical protein
MRIDAGCADAVQAPVWSSRNVEAAVAPVIQIRPTKRVQMLLQVLPGGQIAD